MIDFYSVQLLRAPSEQFVKMLKVPVPVLVVLLAAAAASAQTLDEVYADNLDRLVNAPLREKAIRYRPREERNAPLQAGSKSLVSTKRKLLKFFEVSFSGFGTSPALSSRGKYL